jgi:hypothetical protein
MYSSVRVEVGGPPFAGFRHCRPTLFSSPVLKKHDKNNSDVFKCRRYIFFSSIENTEQAEC